MLGSTSRGASFQENSVYMSAAAAKYASSTSLHFNSAYSNPNSFKRTLSRDTIITGYGMAEGFGTGSKQVSPEVRHRKGKRSRSEIELVKLIPGLKR